MDARKAQFVNNSEIFLGDDIASTAECTTKKISKKTFLKDCQKAYQEASKKAYKKESLYACIVILCAWAFYLYEYILRVSPNVLQQFLMQDYAITATTVGVISSAYYWSYTPLQLPCGIIVDRLGARVVIMASTFLCVLGCFFFANSDSVTTSIFGRLLMGMGSACAYISCAKIGAEWFNADRFAIIAGIGMFMGTVGGLLSAVTSILVEAFDWRGAMMILGIVGIGVFCLAWIIMADSPASVTSNKAGLPATDDDEDENNSAVTCATVGGATGGSPTESCATEESPIPASPVTDAPKTRLLDGLKIAEENPQNWLIGVYGCMMYLPLCAFAELWGVPYLKLLYDVDSTMASLACGSVFIGVGIGSIVGAWLSNKIQSRTRIMSIAAIGTFACFFVVFYVPSLSFTSMRVLLFVGGLFSGGQTLYFVAVKENMPNQFAATAIGFTNAFVMSSAILFQPLLGLILDYVWNGALDIDDVPVYTIDNYKVAFTAVMLAFVIGWIVLLFVKDTYLKEKDILNNQ